MIGFVRINSGRCYMSHWLLLVASLAATLLMWPHPRSFLKTIVGSGCGVLVGTPLVRSESRESWSAEAKEERY